MISRILGILAFVSLLSAWCTGAALAERRVALVIGNSAYQNVTPLPNPARDAAAIAAMLKQAHFDVVLSESNLGNLRMRRSLREFARKAQHADIAVVYYAGHGIEVDGTNYLIPVDAELGSDLAVYDEAIPLDRIVELLEPVRRLRLIILDACRENPFTKKMVRTLATRSVGRGLAKVEVTSTDTVVAFAAKAGMTAEDGDGDHSPFARALLDNLTVPGLDLRIAFGRVRDEVMKSTNRRQEPYVYGSIGGSTVALVPEPKAPVAAAKPARLNEPLSNVLARDYEFAERIGTKEAWQSFLKVHKAGLYADLARAALDKLTAAQAAAKQGKVPAPIVVAKTAPSASVQRNLAPAIGEADVARLLQLHLEQLGCDPGSVDGDWTKQSQRALQQFNKRAHTSLDVKVASLNALDVVTQHKDRVCPLECGKGTKAEGDRCVAIACRHGYVRNKDGDCEREVRKARSRPAAHAEHDGGEKILCDNRFGCRKAPANCGIDIYNHIQCN